MSRDIDLPDWLAIEAEYRAGKRPLRDIASDYGVAESTIRHRAKKNAWVRDVVGTVRRRINDSIAGIAHDVAQGAMRNIMDESVQAGVSDMALGLGNARKVLQQVDRSLSVAADECLPPRDLKTLNEANSGAIETIRRIRQLDEPGQVVSIDKAHRDSIFSAAFDA